MNKNKIDKILTAIENYNLSNLLIGVILTICEKNGIFFFFFAATIGLIVSIIRKRWYGIILNLLFISMYIALLAK